MCPLRLHSVCSLGLDRGVPSSLDDHIAARLLQPRYPQGQVHRERRPKYGWDGRAERLSQLSQPHRYFPRCVAVGRGWKIRARVDAPKLSRHATNFRLVTRAFDNDKPPEIWPSVPLRRDNVTSFPRLPYDRRHNSYHAVTFDSSRARAPRRRSAGAVRLL